MKCILFWKGVDWGENDRVIISFYLNLFLYNIDEAKQKSKKLDHPFLYALLEHIEVIEGGPMSMAPHYDSEERVTIGSGSHSDTLYATINYIIALSLKWVSSNTKFSMSACVDQLIAGAAPFWNKVQIGEIKWRNTKQDKGQNEINNIVQNNK